MVEITQLQTLRQFLSKVNVLLIIVLPARITSHEALFLFQDFKLIEAKDIFERAGCVRVLDTTYTSIPDHSVLTLYFIHNRNCESSTLDDWSHIY